MESSSLNTHMYNKVRKALQDFEIVYFGLLYSKDYDFKMLQLSIMLNYIIELCRAFYIEKHDPEYSGEPCEYSDSGYVGECYNEQLSTVQGNLIKRKPKQIDTLGYTVCYFNAFHNTETNMQISTLKGMIKARNLCTHDIVESSARIRRSVEFIDTKREFIDKVLKGLYEEHSLTYSIDIEKVCNTITDTLDKSVLYGNNSLLYSIHRNNSYDTAESQISTALQPCVEESDTEDTQPDEDEELHMEDTQPSENYSLEDIQTDEESQPEDTQPNEEPQPELEQEDNYPNLNNTTDLYSVDF